MSYFSVLGIKPSQSLTDKDIQDAFDKKKSNIEFMANNGGWPPEEKKSKLCEIMAARDALMDSNERKRLVNEEADSLYREFIKVAEARIQTDAVMTYTEGDVESYSKAFGLEPSVVVKELTKLGMTEFSTSRVNVAIPKRYDQEHVIQSQIAYLEVNNHDTRGKISNLYEFLAYYSTNELGSVETPDSLRAYSREELHTYVLQWNADCMNRRAKDSLTAAYSRLLQSAELMLRSSQNKELYDNSISYQTCEALRIIVSLTPDQRLMPQVAEARIDEIQLHFHCDDATAIAIYNDAIKPGEYRPSVSRKPKIQCVGCLRIVEDSGDTKALCPHCETNLYAKCKCGSVIPAITESCPKCGRSIRALHDIPKYVQQARAAIGSYDFTRASRWIATIEAVDSDVSELSQLKSEASKGLEVQRKLYARLDALCSERKYVEAKTLLNNNVAMSANYPGRQDIYSEIKRAEALKRSYGANLTEDNATEIYRICKDIPGVHLPVPQPAGVISTQYDAGTGNTAIRWEASKSAEVTYSLYRMEGRSKPSMTGGSHLAKGLHDLTFIDSKVNPGSLSWYIVVAEREGLTSMPSVSDYPVKAAKELDEQSIVIDIGSNAVDFVWTLPEGARGIRLFRDGKDRRVPLAAERFTDVTENGKSYKYVFQVCYDFSGTPEYTSGITRYITASPVEAVSFSLKHNSKELVIFWDRPSKNAEVLFIQTRKNYEYGEIYRLSDIEEASLNGKVWRAMLFDGKISVLAPFFGGYRIAAFVQTGNRYKFCHDEEYANFEKLSRDTIKISRMGETLRVSGIAIPQHAMGLYVSLKEGEPPFSPIGRLYPRGSLPNVGIDFHGIEDQKNYYLTFFPKYEDCELSENDGSLIKYATSVKYSTYPREEILCELKWPSKGFVRRKKYNSGLAHLFISVPPDKKYCPAMVVAAGESIQPSSPGDGQTIMLLDEVCEYSYRENFTSDGKRVVKVNTSSLPPGSFMRIFLKNIIDADDYVVRSMGSWVVPPSN